MYRLIYASLIGMAYKDKQKELDYYKKYYLEKKKHKYIPHPVIKQTKEEKLEKKRAWNLANKEKNKIYAKNSREKHKEKRKLETKLWVENNKERSKQYHKEYHKEWYKNNKEATLERNKNWYNNNPERAKFIQIKFRELHPDSVSEGLKKYQKTLKGGYRSLKGSANRRGYEVTLTLEEFSEIVSNPCTYCGENEKRIGVDRIDNKVGYTKDNSAPCCNTCNMMKKAMDVVDFISHVGKIKSHSTIIN